MTRHRLNCGPRYNHGFSLIELMVSLVIGLIISAAAFSAYLGASGAAKMAEAQSRMNEDAQAALAILTQQLRMTGNNPKQTNRIDNTATPTLSSMRNPVYLPTPTYLNFTTTFAPSAFAIRGCDGKFSNLNAPAANRIELLDCVPDTAKPDSVAISYEADQFNTVGTSGGAATDCLGNALKAITATVPSFTTSGTSTTANQSPTEVRYTVADNRFYVGTSTTILSPSLYCQGNGGAGTGTGPQPLVENIEDVQFSYGMLSTSTPAASATTAVVAGYLRAYEISALTDTPETPNEAARWAKVVTVRICVLVRSENPVVSDATSAQYRNCEDALVTAPDLRLRRAYSTTVILRNRRS